MLRRNYSAFWFPVTFWDTAFNSYSSLSPSSSLQMSLDLLVCPSLVKIWPMTPASWPGTPLRMMAVQLSPTTSLRRGSQTAWAGLQCPTLWQGTTPLYRDSSMERAISSGLQLRTSSAWDHSLRLIRWFWSRTPSVSQTNSLKYYLKKSPLPILYISQFTNERDGGVNWFVPVLLQGSYHIQSLSLNIHSNQVEKSWTPSKLVWNSS